MRTSSPSVSEKEYTKPSTVPITTSLSPSPSTSPTTIAEAFSTPLVRKTAFNTEYRTFPSIPTTFVDFSKLFCTSYTNKSPSAVTQNTSVLSCPLLPWLSSFHFSSSLPARLPRALLLPLSASLPLLIALAIALGHSPPSLALALKSLAAEVCMSSLRTPGCMSFLFALSLSFSASLPGASIGFVSDIGPSEMEASGDAVRLVAESRVEVMWLIVPR
mmetsp:Transcript_3276/g.6398  ORF Transcript_3276/g.6398 Transcript_3276/m.6398 type:complete len:217 (-) Transcript_3276:531-1181(-)